MTHTEDLTGQIDGMRVDFATTQAFESGSLEVHLNGVRLQPGEGFQELSTTSFRLVDPPEPGDTLLVQAEIMGPGDTYVFPTVAASGIDPERW